MGIFYKLTSPHGANTNLVRDQDPWRQSKWNQKDYGGKYLCFFCIKSSFTIANSVKGNKKKILPSEVQPLHDNNRSCTTVSQWYWEVNIICWSFFITGHFMLSKHTNLQTLHLFTSANPKHTLPSDVILRHTTGTFTQPILPPSSPRNAPWFSPELIGHGLTSAPTQYRLYGRRFLQVWWPNQQC